MKKSSTLVLGIGNTLLTDEGIGVHVIKRLQLDHAGKSEVKFLDGGTLSFTLAGEIGSHDRLIVVDAARTGSSPGSVVCYEGRDMDRYLKGNRKSVHEVGLGDLLDIARLSEQYPEKFALIGVEPFAIEWGEALSPVVERSLPGAVAAVLELINKWDRAA